MKSKTSQNRNPFKGKKPWLAALTAFWGGSVALLHAVELKNDREVSSRKPVNISSYQLTFIRPQGLTLFTGDVKAVHDKVVLFADQIRALEENREATASGHVVVVDHGEGITLTCGNLEYQDLMDLMTAHDHPALTTLDEKGNPITVLGRQMEVDSVEKTVVINQNVQILHKEGTAEAQKATFYSADDKFVLEDEPKVYTDNGLLSGRRITTNLGADRSVFVEGMADAIFNPNGKPVTNNKEGLSLAKASGTATPSATVTPVADNDNSAAGTHGQSSAPVGTGPGQAPLRPGGPLW